MEQEGAVQEREGQTGGVNIGNVGGSIVGSIISTGTIVVNAFQQLDQGPQKARRLMLDRVEKVWIEGLFSARMSDGAEFSVPFGTRSGSGAGRGEATAPASAEGAQHILILGEPGAGKTIFLLQTVRRKLRAARENASEKIPIVINASNWRERPVAREREGTEEKEAKRFRSWLIRTVQTEYKIAPQMVERWLDNDEAELFLDGMDEVSQDLQDDFVASLRAFQFHALATIYVSCRVADYERLTERFRARGAEPSFQIFQADVVHELGPLSDEAVLEVARAAGRPDLVESLGEREELRELCRSPLFLSLLVRMEADVGWVSKPAELFEAAMKHAFAARASRLPEARIRQAMTSVAWLLETRAQSTFHFSDLGSRAFTRWWQSGGLYAIGALTGLGAVTWMLASLFSGDWGWGKFWLAVYIVVMTFAGLISAAGVKHQGLRFDAVRGGWAALIGGGVGLAVVLLQLGVALAVVTGLVLLKVQPLLALVIAAVIVIAVFIWGMIEGEPLGYVQRFFLTLLGCGMIALLPFWVLEWLVTEGGHGFSEAALIAIFRLGGAMAPPWDGLRVERSLGFLWRLWWRSAATLLLITLAVGFLIGALKPRAADRHTGWGQTLTGMTLGSLVAAAAATALVVAVVATAQFAFHVEPNMGQRWKIGLVVAIGAFAMSGGVAVIYYGVCRVLLMMGGMFPGNFPATLQEAVRLGLMVRLGGSYAFIHKLQLEHLANGVEVKSSSW